MQIKRIVSLIMIFSMLIPFTVLGVSALSEDEITAPSAVLMEPKSRKVLFEKNSHEVRACASITKVMTLILVFEAIDAKLLDLQDMITSSAHAASMGGSDIWLEEGEQMTADDMIKAVVVASANDAAVALAEHIAGSEDEFVSRMNEKAKALGMKNTVFKNCNGLDEEGHLTSAYDVALMSSELIKHEKIFDYSSIWIDELRGGKTQIVNTNKLLKSYSGITGLKTGTTSQAGSCMSATATRDNMSLVAVVLGCDTGTSRFSDAAKLLDYGFANFRSEVLTLSASELTPLKVKGGMVDSLDVECTVNKTAVLPKSGGKKLEKVIEITEEIQAPVEKGAVVGKVSFTYDGSTVDEFDIKTSASAEEITFTSVFWYLMKMLVSF